MIRNVIVKVTLGCNINCRYCYVRRNREIADKSQIMDDATLEALIRGVGQYFGAVSVPDRFVFYWHGGEPLQAGKSFFRRCREFQDRYLPPALDVVNTIQTNGILLDDEWARMARDCGYGICVSLDGPAEINDAWRLTANGRGTYDLVVRGMEALKRNGIPLSVLCVITPEALPHGARIYRELRGLGCSWMDFMYPFYSRIDNTIDVDIQPERWGRFLSDIFDAWIAEGNPDVDIRLLKDFCMLLLGGKTTMCIAGVDCSYVVTVNPDGEVHVCDDLLAYADGRLGNVHRNPFLEIAEHPRLARLSRRDVLFGEECTNCELFSFCKGGCTLFRARGRDDFSARHYYCEAQRQVIRHIRRHFASLGVPTAIEAAKCLA